MVMAVCGWCKEEAFNALYELKIITENLILEYSIIQYTTCIFTTKLVPLILDIKY